MRGVAVSLAFAGTMASRHEAARLACHSKRNDGQVLREAGTAFLAAARGVFGGNGLQRVTGGRHAKSLRFSQRRNSYHAGEQHYELGGVVLLGWDRHFR